MNDMIFAVFTGAVSVILFIYVSFTVRCKGPVLSNTYLFASEEERSRMDKKAEYHMVSVVFGILAVIFAFLTVYINYILGRVPLYSACFNCLRYSICGQRIG